MNLVFSQVIHYLILDNIQKRLYITRLNTSNMFKTVLFWLSFNVKTTRELILPKCIFQPPFTCSKLTVQLQPCSQHQNNVWNLYSKLTVKTPERRRVIDVGLVSLFLTLNRFHTLLWCFLCCLWTTKSQLG